MERYQMDGRNWMEKINGWKYTGWMEKINGWKELDGQNKWMDGRNWMDGMNYIEKMDERRVILQL